jgi:tRNA pseudouridine38-40 synthase
LLGFSGMQRNLKLVIAYDGTEFHGWQTQPGLRTVQEELGKALERVLRHQVALAGASRTDAGVHARGQAASLRTEAAIPTANLQRAVACRLPPDIHVVRVTEAEPEFHATRDASGKLYRYVLYNAERRPVERFAARYAWHCWHALELGAMQAAAAALVGTHDFAAFANQGRPRETTVRTLRSIGIRRQYEQVQIDIEGDSFLYNQVRIIVGTLVEIGRGHWPAERAATILSARDRSLAGPTAPAHGLTLEWVRYSPTWSCHGS